MPVYEYQGKHYELSEGLSNEQALSKIKGHLGKQDSTNALEGALGVGETALSIATGGIAQPLAGLYGIAKGGSGDAVREAQEALTYAPRTKPGQKMTEAVGNAFMYPVEKAADLGEYVAGNEGRLVGQVASETAMNFLPFGLLAKGMKGSKAKGRIEPNKPVEPSMSPMEADFATKPEVQGQLELPLETDISQSPVARQQRMESPQGDLFEPAKDLTPTPREPMAPLDTTAQHPLFDQSEQGRVANPYEASTGDWRVDENGIPIKADLSMELQNLQDPLQRNLWGDELPPKMSPEGMGLQGVGDMTSQQGRPLTEAIDSMGWAQRRGAINRELKGVVESSGALEGAMLEARSPFKPPQSQRGAIDMNAFTSGFMKRKQIANDLELVLKGTRVGPEIQAINKEGKIVGQLNLSSDGYFSKVSPDHNLEAAWVSTDPKKIGLLGDRNAPTAKSPYKGLAAEMYKFAAEVGDIKRSEVQTPEGKAMWDRFEQSGLGKGGKIPWSQRGALDFGRSTSKVSELTQDSPEVVQAKQELVGDAKRAAIAKAVGLSPYKDDVNTPAKVIASAPDAKDITRAQLERGRSITPGANAMAIISNNPLIKFLRGQTQRVFQESNALTKQYITQKGAIADTIHAMTQAEKNRVVEALQLGDKYKKPVTEELMQKHGFTENERKFIEQYQAMNARKLEIWNEARAAVGMKPVSELPGHFPGIFKGDYKQLVIGKNKDGSPKVLGVIAVDSKWQLSKAREAMLREFPEATFTEVDRRKLGGNGNRSDMFSGMDDILKLLEKENPTFAEVKALVDGTIKEQANALYGASFHEMRKKGVVGNEGNKPWRTRDENTNDVIKAYLEHWEEGIISHKNLPVETQIRDLMDNSALDNMPNAKKYVNDYIKNMTGRNLGTIGDALNKLVDTPFRYTGFGSSNARGLVHGINKRASQHLMGWFNYVFSAVQFMQVPQMALPEMMKVASLGGFSSAQAPKSLFNTLRMTPELLKEGSGRESNLPPQMKLAVKEAQDRGLMKFSEFQDVANVNQGKMSKMYDTAVDFNRAIAEKATRPFVFFAAVDMLHNNGLRGKDLYDTAYNLTQRAMIDYSAHEKPMMYNRLGVTGQLAGSLQTFKHGYMSQFTDLITHPRRNPAAAASAIAAIAVYSGIKGVPFYQELDEMVKYLSNEFGDKRQGIGDMVTKNLPEWAKSGLLSDSTNFNFQSRLSAADMLPNSPGEAVSPYATFLGNILSAGKEVVTEQDPLAVKNFMRSVTPSGPAKGLMESAIGVAPDGTPIDKRGELGNKRTPTDSAVRKYSGATTLEEALRNEKQYNQMQNYKASQEKLTSIVADAKRDYIQGLLTKEKWQEYSQKYVARGGDVKQLINTLNQYAVESKKTRQQRLEGIPKNSIGSINRWKNFNEE